MDQNFNDTMQRELIIKERKAQTEMFAQILKEVQELKQQVAQLQPKRSTPVKKSATKE